MSEGTRTAKLVAITGAMLGLWAAPSSSFAAARPAMTIRVIHLAADEGWRVEYQLPAPTRQLRFMQRFGQRRCATWRVETPNQRIVGSSSGEVLESTNGEPFTHAVISFASDESKFNATYPLNQRFSDGSEWIYVGHLFGEPDDGKFVHPVYELVPRAGEAVVVQGRRSKGPQRWRDPSADAQGTFVYFGHLAPIESTHSVMLIEPQLPSYLRDAFTAWVPKLMDVYAARLGRRNNGHPQIFIAYSREGSGHQGDVVPGAAAFLFRGEQWAQRSEQNLATAAILVGHETAHLWNGDAYESAENEHSPWLHEGSADALAWLALEQLHLMDDAQLLERLEAALNACVGVSGVGALSLDQAAQQGRYDLAYSCGATLQLLAHFQLRARGGLFELWRNVFEHSRARGNRYDSEMFFATLERLAGDSWLATTLRAFVRSGTPDPLAALRPHLVAAGLQLEPSAPPAQAATILPREALFRLMLSDCGFVSFNYDGARFLVFGSERCKHLRAKLPVTSIAGVPIENNGLAAYMAAYEGCRVARAVKLEHAEGGIEVPCDTPLPEPSYVRLRRSGP